MRRWSCCMAMLLAAMLPAAGCRNGNAPNSGSAHKQYAFITNGKSNTVSVVDLATFRVEGQVAVGSDPTGVATSPIRNEAYVVNTGSGTVSFLNAETLAVATTLRVGRAPYSLALSPDGRSGYVANSESGSVSVIDFATRQIVATWPIPGGGSPDMGNVSADGKYLWLSGRFDNVVYAIDTTTGAVKSIAVGKEPHGLTVWPQPGRYSLGHTGNLR